MLETRCPKCGHHFLLPENAAPCECGCPACAALFLPVPVPPRSDLVSADSPAGAPKAIIDDSALRNFRDATTPQTKSDFLLAGIAGVASVLLWGPALILFWGIDIAEMRNGSKIGVDPRKARRIKTRITIGLSA